MKYVLEVCLVALTLANAGEAQTMQKGIHVELPIATNAIPVPKADNADALIITVTYDGKVYLGVDPISAIELREKVKEALSNRAEKTLYIKEDARTTYESLVKVLDLVRTAGVEEVTLLTAQPNVEESGILVSPKGLEMQIIPSRTVARN